MLIKVARRKDKHFILIKDHSVDKVWAQEITDDVLFDLFSNHNKFIVEIGFNKFEVDSMEGFEGETIAYINDAKELCIVNMDPFRKFIIDSSKNIDNLLTVQEYADKVGRTIRQIRFHITDDRIPGAIKLGRDWFIPKSSVDKYPEDNRVITGEYRKK